MKITSIKNSTIIIEGDSKHRLNQIIIFDNKYKGITIKASSKGTHVLVDDASQISMESIYELVKSEFKVKFDSDLFGKISDPFGKILFSEEASSGNNEMYGNEESFQNSQTHGNRQPFQNDEIYRERKVFKKAPMFYDRKKLDTPLETGIFAIDSLIPIGRGQRQLILGDRKTGKTSIALSTIINNAGSDLKVIYVSIGQKQTSLNSVYSILKEHNALHNVAIVVGQPELKLSQYLVPYICMAYAESIQEQGKDVLIILDDLSKHANIYREISLNMNKSGGREAYPSDLFYAHSKLLERVGKFSGNLGNGSITALPIIETIESNFTDVLSTNIISITDGQIIMDTSTAKDGHYPAIDIGNSVSRTGSAVQNDFMKVVKKIISPIYAQYIDAKKYKSISFEASESIKQSISKGETLIDGFRQFGYIGKTAKNMYLIVKILELNVTTSGTYSLEEILEIAQRNEAGNILINEFDENNNVHAQLLKAYFLMLLNQDNIYNGKRSKIEMENS